MDVNTEYNQFITDNPTQSVTNLQACMNECGESSECKYWTFDSKASVCDLSDSRAHRIPVVRPGKVSGDKACGLGEH